MLYEMIIKKVVPPIIIKGFVKEINGIDNIPKDLAFIIASNHASYMDHFVIASIITDYLDKKVYFLAKKEHFKRWHERKWHEIVGTIPIDRSAGESALIEAAEYLKRGKIIGIYPEGTRSLDGKLQKGKTGIARVVLRAKVPVIPIGLTNTFEILPKGKIIPKFKKKIEVNIGKLLYFKEYYDQELNYKVLREITDEIMMEITKLSIRN